MVKKEHSLAAKNIMKSGWLETGENNIVMQAQRDGRHSFLGRA